MKPNKLRLIVNGDSTYKVEVNGKPFGKLQREDDWTVRNFFTTSIDGVVYGYGERIVTADSYDGVRDRIVAVLANAVIEAA